MTKKGIIGVIVVLFTLGIIMATLAKYKTAPSIEGKQKPKAVQQSAQSSMPSMPLKQYKIDMNSIPQVIAVVNGVKIDKKPFLRVLAITQKQMAEHKRILTKENYESVKSEFIKNITNAELLSQEADAKGIKADEKRVNEAIDRFASQFKDKEAFKARLANDGIDTDGLKKEVTRSFKINRFIKEVAFAGIKTSDEQLRKAYDKNRANFELPRRIRVRHILLKLAPDADDETVKKAEAKMDDIIAKLKKGEKFEELAKKYSQGPSKVQGGDLGFFSVGNMVKEFEDVAFSLKPGDFPKTVRSRFGLHLVETTDVKEAGLEPFEKAKEKLRASIEGGKKSNQLEKLLADLRKKATIKLFL